MGNHLQVKNIGCHIREEKGDNMRKKILKITHLLAKCLEPNNIVIIFALEINK